MKKGVLLFLLCLYPLITISYSQENNDRQQLHHKTENDVVKLCEDSGNLQPYKDNYLSKYSYLDKSYRWFHGGFQKRLVGQGRKYAFLQNEEKTVIKKGENGKNDTKYVTYRNRTRKAMRCGADCDTKNEPCQNVRLMPPCHWHR